MPVDIQRSSERGVSELGWLHSRFSFSFADYYNPKRMGFGALRVLNDDIIGPGAGFGMHPHSNYEIVTIVLEGALEHADSMGNRGIIRAGEVQCMSAGRGVMHSEHNASAEDKAILLQVWVKPDTVGAEPRYSQAKLSEAGMEGKLAEIVSGNRGVSGPLKIRQDARFLLGNIGSGAKAVFSASGEGKGAYVFVVSGAVKIGNERLSGRDAAGITGEKSFEIAAEKNSTVLVIEVPME
ncbi:MAG: pirin family protein [Candidatus Diapherotrites archaeon]|uniref:Pirin family protein n=1 Tax=Candidatus Iainarchaeum sp. TaxID=3101447 RepID=A0A8T3YLJ1_9ARCH|nr:pirin family protein [Candidatus Diapherotrites archaeon]